jgi:hypothetical protein
MFYGYLTGRPYETIAAMQAGEKEIAQREAAMQTPDPFYEFDGPTPEDIKAAHEEVVRATQDQAKNVSEERAAEIFCHLHPEFVQNKRNAAAIEMLLQARGVIEDRYVTVEDIETAYDELRQRGLIDIDNAKLAEAHRAEVSEQANTIRTARRSSGISNRTLRTVSRSTRQSHNEADLENMPLDQLRELAMREAYEGV